MKGDDAEGAASVGEWQVSCRRVLLRELDSDGASADGRYGASGCII